jgi:Ca2+-transporting ATPase
MRPSGVPALLALLLLAVLSTFLLQLAVIYLPLLQHTFETTPLRVGELAISLGLASLIMFAVEIEKMLRRERDRKRITVAPA